MINTLASPSSSRDTKLAHFSATVMRTQDVIGWGSWRSTLADSDKSVRQETMHLPGCTDEPVGDTIIHTSTFGTDSCDLLYCYHHAGYTSVYLRTLPSPDSPTWTTFTSPEIRLPWPLKSGEPAPAICWLSLPWKPRLPRPSADASSQPATSPSVLGKRTHGERNDDKLI